MKDFIIPLVVALFFLFVFGGIPYLLYRSSLHAPGEYNQPEFYPGDFIKTKLGNVRGMVVQSLCYPKEYQEACSYNVRLFRQSNTTGTSLLGPDEAIRAEDFSVVNFKEFEIEVVK